MGRDSKAQNVGAERTMCKGLESWWRDKYMYHSRTVLHDDQVQACPWLCMINNVRAWEAKILRLTFRPRMKPDETWVGYRARTAKFFYEKVGER